MQEYLQPDTVVYNHQMENVLQLEAGLKHGHGERSCACKCSGRASVCTPLHPCLALCSAPSHPRNVRAPDPPIVGPAMQEASSRT